MSVFRMFAYAWAILMAVFAAFIGLFTQQSWVVSAGQFVPALTFAVIALALRP